MTDVAVRVENLGKLYNIGSPQPARLLREALTDLLFGPARKVQALIRHGRTAPGPRGSSAASHIWALRGVSFEVERGEVLGIVGPNGAGKSTLLKILSRITEPTEGRVEIYGRVASLLEVGTGFHPELTGRENIHLSGAFLGMRNADVKRNLDQIIDFSGVTKFIDTPVKHYSSGMYVRLAFAVAAHLGPDVLIVDEVLSVGDIAFQRKCLAKMEEVRQQGRTIVLVSHNMHAVTRLCQRALLISEGTIQNDGPAEQIISAYLFSSLSSSPQRVWPDPSTAPQNHIARLRSVRVRTKNGATADRIDIRDPVGIEMVYDVLSPGRILIPYYDFFNESGLCIFAAQDVDPAWRRRPRPVGTFTSTAWIPGHFLTEGGVLLGAGLFSNDPYIVHFHHQSTVAFHVVGSHDAAIRGDGNRSEAGVVRPRLNWTTQHRPDFSPGLTP